MAVTNYFNIEPLALDTINETIELISDCNYDGETLREEDLVVNMKYGFIVITELIAFFEGFLNTIINRCLDIDDENVFKQRTPEKVEYIFKAYKKCDELAAIKTSHYYESFIQVEKVRNEMIDHKRTYIGE